jgi:hypothetical protein
MVIFSHIEHILHNHFATFYCGLGFLKFLTFSLWSLCKDGASLANGIYSWLDHRGDEIKERISLN